MDFGLVLPVLLLLTALCFHYRRRLTNLPPGPYPFPIIGNIFQLGTTPHQSLAKLSKIYGPLMSLHLGSRYAVVISSPEIAKEMLQKHDLAFSGRAIPAAAEAHDHEKMSMLFLSVGDDWRKLRKISREHMFTSSRLGATQGLRNQYLQKLCDYVQNSCRNGVVVDLREATFITTLNLMSATLFSAEVADFDSDSTHEFKEIFEGLTNVVGIPNSADFFPILKPFDPQGIQRKSRVYFGKLLDFIDNIVKQRLESRNASDYANKNDFLEVLLDLCHESENQLLNVDVIKHLLLDLFAGGSDTTASVMEWAMMELLFHPDKLSTAKQELRAVIGDENNVIGESDVSRLPYLQAVIKEAFRLHPPAPLLVPRRAEYDERVYEYTIPKGTHILINVWAIGRDPTLWSNPEAFEPERFLDRKIDFKGQDFELIPFGCGRRICPGLALANPMLHTMVATLIHKFDWKLEAGEAYENHEGQLSGLSLRSPHPLRATPIHTCNNI